MNRIDYNRPALAVFADYIRPHRKAFILDMTLSVLAAAVDLIFPYATRGAMNSLLPTKMYAAFFTVMAILLGAYLLRAWFQYLITIVGHRMGTLAEAD
ncbi:MAG: ABC transporter ATP-binding protein, partial [Candidatus Limivicinus sp.]